MRTVVLSLAALTLLPLIEMVLRRFHSGLSGSTAFVQHFTLIVGMLGGAIAARDARLLSFSTLASFLKGRIKVAARILSSGAAAAISALLCFASLDFLQTERQGGSRLAYRLWKERRLDALIPGVREPAFVIGTDDAAGDNGGIFEFDFGASCVVGNSGEKHRRSAV